MASHNAMMLSKALEVAPLDTLDLDEAAAVLRLGIEATQELIASGQLPALSLNRKHCVVLRSDLIEFIRVRSRQQQQERAERYQPSDANEVMQMTAAEPRRRRGRPARPLPVLQ